MLATTYAPRLCGAGAPARDVGKLRHAFHFRDSDCRPMFIRHRHMAVSANSAFSQSIVSQATSACAENGCGFVCHVLYWWAKGLASRGSGLNAQTLSARRWHLPFAGEGARATLTINKPRIHLHAIVVMPDHVHILLRPLRDENGWPFPLVDILQCFKGATSHRINKLLGTRSEERRV